MNDTLEPTDPTIQNEEEPETLKKTSKLGKTGTLKGKKKATASKKPQDTMTRFFNSYGDSPHL
jgi:hypothetical protein